MFSGAKKRRVYELVNLAFCFLMPQKYYKGFSEVQRVV